MPTFYRCPLANFFLVPIFFLRLNFLDFFSFLFYLNILGISTLEKLP